MGKPATMRTQQVLVGELVEHPRNPRRGDVEAIRASIKAHGFFAPVVAQKSSAHVLVGNHRLRAAIAEGMTSVPVVWLDVDDDEALRVLLVDNRASDLGSYAEDVLASLLADLTDRGGLEGTLWTDGDLDGLLASLSRGEGQTPPDDVPDPPEDPKAKLGDLWILGQHRLLCGDSTKPEDVARVMDGHTAAIFATDPPYGVDYTGKRPSRSRNPAKRETGKDWTGSYHEVRVESGKDWSDEFKDSSDGWPTFLRSFTEAAVPHLALDAAWYLWHAHRWTGAIYDLWTELGVLPHQQIIWAKPAAMFSTAYFNWQHEPCLFGWRAQHRPSRADADLGARTTSLWTVTYDGGARKQQADHPTQKPVELFALPMRIHTQPGALCYEPFCGSGSQIIAAEMQGRRCYAIEIEPRFIDVAVARFEQFSGKSADVVRA